MIEEIAPGLRQRQTARRAVQKARAQIRLERRNPLADRGFGDPELPRGGPPCRVDMPGEMRMPPYRRINARLETPVLITEDGCPLTETMAIAAYLEAGDA